MFSQNTKQMIIYGAPGTGKSYLLEKSILQNGFLYSDIFRVTLHEDMTYADFIGYTTPKIVNNNEISYLFEAGPFTAALVHALKTNRNTILIIEELNRGNASTIFGDIFQLLDRNSSSYSSYPVRNSSIYEYMKDSDCMFPQEYNLADNDIVIPSNLYIYATMNTADQNVYPIDSAFKRRFQMMYVPISFDITNSQLLEIDRISKMYIFNNLKTWSDFAKKINSIIDSINIENNLISEDKKLGPFFVEKEDVLSKQAFCDKVIYYLKHDVFKYDNNYFRLSYDEIFEQFVENNNDIFIVLGIGG